MKFDFGVHGFLSIDSLVVFALDVPSLRLLAHVPEPLTSHFGDYPASLSITVPTLGPPFLFQKFEAGSLPFRGFNHILKFAMTFIFESHSLAKYIPDNYKFAASKFGKHLIIGQGIDEF